MRQRADGRWEARYTVGRNAGTGKQIQKSVYGATQKEVRQKLQQICNDINNGIFTEPSKFTIATWFDVWLKEYNSNVKPYTMKAYKEKVNLYIKPALGAIKLTAIAAPAIQKFINSLSSGTDNSRILAPKTIKCVHGVLHKGLQQAVILGYIRFNPADNCALPKMEQKQIKPLEQDEVKRFLVAIQGNKFEFLFLVDLFTGLRQSEILGLTWDNVHFKDNTIYVCHQLQREPGEGGKYKLTSLKNNKTRKITVADTVMQHLENNVKSSLKNERRRLTNGKRIFPTLYLQTSLADT
jgi:integrase